MFAITNARLVMTTGEVVERGTVLIDGGKVVASGAHVEIPKGIPVRDWEGKVLNHQVIGHVKPLTMRQAKHFCSVKPWRPD